MLLDGPINALSTNRDSSLVVVAGRNVLKTFAIEEDQFLVERLNLRVGRNINLNFGALDVSWNPVEESIIATAATNGAVVVWNLARPQRNKLESTYTDHKRTVNKVSFHCTEPNYLLSGSQDTTVNLFDLRREKYCITFKSGTESIRDVKFSPHHQYVFAAADEAGNVNLWDVRYVDRPFKIFSAHGAPVLSLDFHPTSKASLATGSRDKLIKVWDINEERPPLVYSVQTVASVSLIRWRPQREWHIASCSLAIDNSINVWDLRRPFIPFASFEEHKDVATGIAFRNDPHFFFSCGKDGSLLHHDFKNAGRPVDFANPVTMDLAPQGDVGLAVSGKLLADARRRTPEAEGFLPRLLPAGMLSSRHNDDMFRAPVPSQLFLFHSPGTAVDDHISMDWLIVAAKEYKLYGKSFADLCEHNAEVAKRLSRFQTVAVWLTIKELFSAEKASKQAVVSKNSSESQRESEDGKEGEMEGVGEEVVFPPTKGTSRLFQIREPDQDLPDSLTDPLLLDSWKLEAEAFTPEMEFFSTEGEFPHSLPWVEHVGSADRVLREEGAELELTVKGPPGVVVSKDFLHPASSSPRWDPLPLLKQLLCHSADCGDVQQAVSILLVLGDKAKDIISPSVQEMWYLSYLDLLERFELWVTAALVIKLCPLPSVNTLSQESTSLRISCGRCDKGIPLQKVAWLCQNCKKGTRGCSVCQDRVKGLWSWCRRCEHGGHLEHMRAWFETQEFCPAGCGHRCEYVQL